MTYAATDDVATNRDIVRENIGSYLGDQARRDWSADSDLYPVEATLIERHFPAAPAHLLDLGCGAGRTTLGLEARGYDVDALDLSEDLVAAARERLIKSRVVLMDARTLAYPDATFDAALFSFNGLDCIHPSAERTKVLDEVHRVLKPGGVFYYSGHNALAAWWPRPGDSARRFMNRNTRLLLAQRRTFTERLKYLAYPEPAGTQVLYSAIPQVHVHEQREHGFEPVAVYGSRSYRRGPHHLEHVPPSGPRFQARLLRLALSCPHMHYVARKIE